MSTEIPLVTPYTTTPSRQSPSTFSADRDTRLAEEATRIVQQNSMAAAMNTVAGEMEAMAAAMTLAAATDTSSSSVAIGAGEKTFTVTAGKSFAVGMSLKIAHDAENWMLGEVSSYSGITLVMNITKYAGSGTETSWTISLSGPTGANALLVRLARTSNTILSSDEFSYLIDITSGTFSQTFTAASTLGVGWFCYYRNSGAGVVTLDPDSSETIDGATTLLVYPNEARLIICTGTAFYTLLFADNTNHEVIVHTGNGYGSTNNKIRRFTTTMVNVGTAITYADSATDGASFTINAPGVYAMYFSDYSSSPGATCGISANSNELTKNIESIAVANRICHYPGVHTSFVSITRRFSAGDVVRPHTNGYADGTGDTTYFQIRKVSS